MGDIAEKAIRQVHRTVFKLVSEGHTADEAARIAAELTSGQWTHDFPLDVEELRAIGLPIRDEIPREVYELMDLYPRTRQQRPSVEFIPTPYAPPVPPPQRTADRGPR